VKIIKRAPTKNQKLQRFFGADPSGPKLKDLDDFSSGTFGSLFKRSSPVTANFSKSKKTFLFFGERPPDEVIVDQLEQFFPGIENNKVVIDKSIKNIVKANIKAKRNSNRQSSLMIRRQQGSMILKERPQGIQIPEKSKVREEEVIAVETPKPFGFRWAPGRIIGQGAFGKVYHALNLETGDFMAVKQVLDGSDENQQQKLTDSLQREIDLLQDLDHENIVRYLGFLN
jgi:mitogen-activated protein kinase kinase kinase